MSGLCSLAKDRYKLINLLSQKIDIWKNSKNLQNLQAINAQQADLHALKWEEGEMVAVEVAAEAGGVVLITALVAPAHTKSTHPEKLKKTQTVLAAMVQKK